jgi:hypothetical protein
MITESKAYVVPFSVQSMITQTDKDGKQVKLAHTVSCSLSHLAPLLFPSLLLLITFYTPPVTFTTESWFQRWLPMILFIFLPLAGEL